MRPQVDHLRGLLELVVRKEPTLLPEFLPEVLELQASAALVAVRTATPLVPLAACGCQWPCQVHLPMPCCCTRGGSCRSIPPLQCDAFWLTLLMRRSQPAPPQSSCSTGWRACVGC